MNWHIPSPDVVEAVIPLVKGRVTAKAVPQTVPAAWVAPGLRQRRRGNWDSGAWSLYGRACARGSVAGLGTLSGWATGDHERRKGLCLRPPGCRAGGSTRTPESFLCLGGGPDYFTCLPWEDLIFPHHSKGRRIR